MPISFFIYLLGMFGFVVSMITANHMLDPYDYIYSDWMDQLVMAYFGMTFAFVCWWGAMRRLEATFACFVLQWIVGTMIRAMTTPALYDTGASTSSSDSDTIAVAFVMAIIFLLVHGIGNMIRFITEFIVAMGRRYSST